MPRFFVLAFLLLLAVPPASAREQSDAPDAEIIGFSADGRYFAFEQFGYDSVSDSLSAAIFVVDRATNRQADGFPFGVVPEERDGEFPAKVGGFDPDPALLDTNDYDPDLGALRKALRDAAAAKLDALGIGEKGRRVAGVPLTQRAPAKSAEAPIQFVLWPTLPGSIPDQQYVYSITARQSPEPDDCVNVMPPARTKSVTFDVAAARTYPETVEFGRAATTVDIAVPGQSCAAGLWISDIVAPPKYVEEAPAVAVLFLTVRWESFTEGASWNALFVNLPVEKQ